MLNRNFIVLIATISAIENCWLCVQGFIFHSPQHKFNNQKGLPSPFPYLLSNTDKGQGVIGFFDEYPAKVDDSSSHGSQLESERNQYVNVSQHPGELCSRECRQGDNRICYFKFTLEHYQAMGVACGRCRQGVEEDCNHPQCIVGDGFEKGVMSINRRIPGPPILVCKDDLIIVDVRNSAGGTATSIHWHGIHQEETPFMDGMPFLTQCPIQYSNSFRYQFKATQPGTQFYHSHSGHQKANGQYGVLTVRQPKELEPLGIFYDYDLAEHQVFISDWMHSYAEQLFPGLPSSFIGPDSVLINGRGVYTNPQTFKRSSLRPTIYYVTRGRRYLFRLVNAVNHFCPFQMQIENHTFNIIASDSFTVMARTFDTLISNAGERYDFILDANKEIGDYWMRVRGLGICAANRLESYALIRYVDADCIGNPQKLPVPPFPDYDVPFPAFTVLNHPNATCWDGDSNQCITELTAYEDDDDLRYSKPEHKFFLAFNNYIVPNEEIFTKSRYFHFQILVTSLFLSDSELFRNAACPCFPIDFNGNSTMVGAINNLSLTFPDYSLLTQPELIDESKFCDENNRPAECTGLQICHCIHRLKVKKDSIVELIIVDETNTIGSVNHPFHLHGYKFMVAGIGFHPLGLPMTVKRAIEMESKSLLSRDSLNISPPFKDTVSIPSHGYAVLRLRASNPGFWLMHCHYEWHLSIGMGLILQVGEPSEMVKAPSGFPKCGNYLPPPKSTLFRSKLKKKSNYTTTRIKKKYSY